MLKGLKSKLQIKASNQSFKLKLQIVVQIVVQMRRYFDEANFDVGGLVSMAHHTLVWVVREPCLERFLDAGFQATHEIFGDTGPN